MTQKLFALSLGFAGLILATEIAQAQSAPQCGQRAAVIERLTGTFGETRHGIGLATGNAVMEVFASATTGSWTIIVTLADGRTCLIAAGESYEALTETLPAAGKGA